MQLIRFALLTVLTASLIAAAPRVLAQDPAASSETAADSATVPAAPPSWTIEHSESVFAVITHKDGLGAKLAHNHLVRAQDVTASLSLDPLSPEQASLRFEAPVASLRIDLPADQSRWYPRLEELGILSEAFSEIAPDKRADIRASMIGRKQLDAKAHPTLSAQTTSIRRLDEERFSINLSLEIKGQSMVRAIEGRYRLEGEKLSIEASGVFEFTDFGIKPYSALLGAVKNSNTFHVYLHLVATPAPSAVAP